MTKAELVGRWVDEQFLQQSGSVLRLLVQPGEQLTGLDLRGIRIGPVDNAGVHQIGLQGRLMREVDFSFSRLECSFIGSRLESTIFSEATLDNAAFMKTILCGSRFDACVFFFCGFDDATIADCDFAGSKFKERRHLSCSALRAKIERCNFSRCVFDGMQFRASEIRGCHFEDAGFSFCDFRGTKFFGAAPGVSQMKQCVLGGATLDGRPLQG